MLKICPHCNKNGIQRKSSFSKILYCPICKKYFKTVHEKNTLSFVDGIFLNKNTDLKERSRRYVEEICNILNLSDNTKKTANKLLDKYNYYWGHRTIVATMVYISSCWNNERRTQREVGEAANIGDNTITQYIKLIGEKMGKDWHYDIEI